MSPARPSPSPGLRISGDISIGGAPLCRNIEMRVRGGEWTALLGPSGSGKSTLLRLIAGLTGDGAAGFDGAMAADDGLALTGRLGYMAQDDLLLEWTSITRNIALGNRLRGEMVDKARLAAITKSVGLAGHEGKRPGQLSGGQRQRVALARTLMEDRPVVLLDEPFSMLDVRTRMQMQDLAVKQLAGRTILLVTHDPFEAARLCPSIYLMQDGGVEKMRALSAPFPKAVDDEEVFALQSRLIKKIRAAA